MTGVVVQLASIGSHARRALVEGAHGEVVGVFKQSFHLVLDGRYVCIGTPDIGNGPLNAITGETPPQSWQDIGVAAGQACLCVGARLRIEGAVEVSYERAIAWTPPPWPAWSGETVRQSLAALAALALPRMPRNGLAVVAFGTSEATGIANALHRRALLSTATVADWLADALDPSAGGPDAVLARAAADAANGLLGLGPGLTPAGDDVLAGLLVSLRAADARTAADALASVVRAAATERTTGLSAAFLDAAADGIPGEAMARTILALLGGNDEDLPACLDAIDDIGHTSGWDMLAGVALGLAAVAAARTGPSR